MIAKAWFCYCIMTQNSLTIDSVKPKSSARIIHQYTEHPLQSDNTSSFQPSVKYSLLNPMDDSHLSQLSRSEMEEEHIYEVLDDEDNNSGKAKARGVNRGVIILGDKNGPYNKLEYSENSQCN